MKRLNKLNVHNNPSKRVSHNLERILARGIEAIKLATENGFDVNSKDDKGNPSLCIAVSRGNIEIVKFLIEKGANMESHTTSGYTPLHLAVWNQHIEIANLLVEKGAKMESRTDSGYTPLHLAATKGNVQLANLLVEKGADMESHKTSGGTPLHLAVWNQHIEIANLLVEKGANMESRTNGGDTPLHLATIKGNVQLANLLVEKGADMESHNTSGYTPLHLAAIKGNVQLANLLVEKGANMGSHNTNGDTPLHLAVWNQHIEIVKFLIEKGANMESHKTSGDTPLHLAAIKGNVQLANLLVEKGANMESHNTSGNTPLHLATIKGNVQLANLLVEKGANMDENNKSQALRNEIETLKAQVKNLIQEKESSKNEIRDLEAQLYILVKEKEASQTEITGLKDQPDVFTSNRGALEVETKLNKDQASTNKLHKDYKSAAVSKNTQKKILDYSIEEITKLLGIQIGKQATIKMVDLRHEKLNPEGIRDLMKPALEEGKAIAAVLQINDQSYGSLLVKKNDDILKLIYNDPRGSAFSEEKNVKSLIRNIKDLEDNVSMIDLVQKQQVNEGDSAAFVVDNLVTLVKNSTTDLKKLELQKLLSTSQQIGSIKAAHSLIGDTNPWYSDDKLKKLLEIELKDKQVSVAPAVVFENKELLVEITKTAAKEVMDSGHPTVIPVQVHGNHWTGLVIKKQADNSLQVIYNDPKGDKLASEKHSGALMKAITTVNSNMHIVDLHKSQQANDDDCGVFTVDNLVKLASCNADSTVEAMQGFLATADNNGRADNLRMQHANELCDAVVPAAHVDVDLTGDLSL